MRLQSEACPDNDAELLALFRKRTFITDRWFFSPMGIIGAESFVDRVRTCLSTDRDPSPDDRNLGTN